MCINYCKSKLYIKITQIPPFLVICYRLHRVNYSKASLWVPTSEAYDPFCATNSECVPSSMIFPSEHTAIWCALCTVLNLWAMTNVVLSFIRRFNALWTNRSLTASSALVACNKKAESHIILTLYLLQDSSSVLLRLTEPYSLDESIRE